MSEYLPTQSRALTVRLKGSGPVGYLRADVPCSLAQLRAAMHEQGVPPTLPNGSQGFRFLAGGIPISLAQEDAEDYQEGDVFIAALPPGTKRCPMPSSDVRSVPCHESGGGGDVRRGQKKRGGTRWRGG